MNRSKYSFIAVNRIVSTYSYIAVSIIEYNNTVWKDYIKEIMIVIFLCDRTILYRTFWFLYMYKSIHISIYTHAHTHNYKHIYTNQYPYINKQTHEHIHI